MDSSLVGLLNSAASADPTTVVAAGQQLISLTSNNEASNSTLANLACVVFSDFDSQLTLDGRFVGLIHLKNAMFDTHIWQNLHPSERALVRDRLLAYLASGQMPMIHLNKVEQLPRIGPCMAELVARLVRNEWLKDGWTDELWDELISWSAWMSLRAALRAAASFRLPARRRAFLQLVRMLLPKVINLWKMVISTPEIEGCIRLSLLLHTCIVSVGGDPLYGPFLFADDYGSFASTIFEGILLSLDKLLEYCQESNGSAGPARLLRRMCKLLLVLFMSCSSAVRDQFVRPVLVHVVQLITSYPLLIGARKGCDERSVTWLLALVYGIQSAVVPDCRSRFPLNEKGVDEVKTWMFTPVATDSGAELTSVRLSHLLFVLLQYWFPLSSNDKRCLATDPEGCLASGGSSGTDGLSYSSPSATAHITSALAIWDADSQARELVKLNVPTLLGFQGSELQIHMFQPCRQLVELLVTLMVREFGDETRTLLFHVVTVKTWMFTPVATDSGAELTSVRLSHLLFVLLQYWFPLSSNDKRCLATDPEGCLASGGSSGTDGLSYSSPSATAHITSALAIWDADSQARELVKLNVPTLLGFQGSELQIHMFQPCRQLVELLVTLMVREFGDETRTLLFHVVTLCTKYFLSKSSIVYADVYTHSPVFSCILIDSLEQRCTAAIVQLIRFLNCCPDMISPSSASVPSTLCLRLSAANALSWMLDQPLPSDEYLTAHLSPLFNSLVELIQDVSECETRIFLLGILCKLIEVAEMSSCPQLASQLLNLLDRLWHLGKWTCVLLFRLIRIVTRTKFGPLLFLKIVRGSLILACRAGREQANAFLRRWTEPFWSTVWQAYTTSTQFSTDGHTSRTQNRLDFLYSSAAAVGFADVGEGASDAESPCRIIYLHILHNMHTVPGPTQNAVIQTLTSARLDSLSPPPIENETQLCELVLLAVERWLARADSLTDTIDRRCYAVACLVSLTYCAQFSVSSGVDFGAHTDHLERWAVADTIHSRWLEPVINLYTQSAALRSKILDAICLLLGPLNWCADADAQTIALRTSLQSPIASLIMAAIRASDTSGADALFDPGLRLWASFVTGDEACWSPAVDSLMALLVGQPGILDSGGNHFTQPDHVEPLLNRLETGEQTEVG
ncbi:hypothetical protein AHF37_06797 [Paragonimus kellicotti]|nr:hypothetical protein AHF37_06797 [Paragonimus kellicotti]